MIHNDNWKGRCEVYHVFLEQLVTRHLGKKPVQYGQEGSYFPEKDRHEFRSLAKVLGSDLLWNAFCFLEHPFLTYLPPSHPTLCLLSFHPLIIYSSGEKNLLKASLSRVTKKSDSVIIPH